MTRTLTYYNQNALAFISHTQTVNFQDTQERFLSCLPPGSRILDFGCGSGRDTYDGIWACASILHLRMEELTDVFRRMILALHEEGILYVSFKLGNFRGERNGRYFTDFDESGFRKYAEQFPELTIRNLWITADVRSGREEEQWLNIILQKSAIH